MRQPHTGQGRHRRTAADSGTAKPRGPATNGADNADATEAAIVTANRELKHRREFRFNNCRPEIRDGFFQAVGGYPFSVRALVVRKDLIQGSNIQVDKEDFYRTSVHKLLTDDGGTLTDAHVFIDGSGDRAFRKKLKADILIRNKGKVADVKLAKSHNKPLIQLADMCVGAIARSYRLDRGDPDRWRNMLQPRIAKIGEFPE